MMTPELIELMKTLVPQSIAKEICSVQPMPDIDWSDPLLNQILDQFVARQLDSTK